MAQREVICIDPGHPSEVGRGTHGRRISEIALVWRIAVQLRRELKAQGYQVVLTKSAENQFVSNRQRAAIANRANAALMLRLHCDASTGSGFTTYYPDRQGTSHGTTGPSQEVLARSKSVAVEFHRALVRGTDGAFQDNGLKPDVATAVGSKQGALTGSIFSKVPVVLVEMCVLTNHRDEDLMLSPKGQRRMIEALAAAVRASVSPAQRTQ